MQSGNEIDNVMRWHAVEQCLTVSLLYCECPRVSAERGPRTDPFLTLPSGSGYGGPCRTRVPGEFSYCYQVDGGVISVGTDPTGEIARTGMELNG
jgi:hypothetical protein